MYGAQTAAVLILSAKEFENDVEMYGAQTSITKVIPNTSFKKE